MGTEYTTTKAVILFGIILLFTLPFIILYDLLMNHFSNFSQETITILATSTFHTIVICVLILILNINSKGGSK